MKTGSPMKTQAIAVAVLLFLTACKTTEQSLKDAGHKPLTADQIKQVFVGNTFIGTSGRTGNAFEGVYEKNGTVRVVTSNGRKDSGTWRTTKDNTLCTKYTWLRGGTEVCRRYYKVGNEIQSVRLDGTPSSRFKVIKGNPKGL